METKEIIDRKEKQKITRLILESLSDWFGIEESRENYIKDSVDCDFVAAYDDENPVGFICLKQTGKDTVELHVLGVLKQYHRKGIGKELFEKAKQIATAKGYLFIQVKTVQMGKYEEYDDTNRFYLSLGFKEFEVIDDLWDEDNPCQIYVMYIGN